MIVCARPECPAVFEPKAHQSYCTRECKEAAARVRRRERKAADRAQRARRDEPLPARLTYLLDCEARNVRPAPCRPPSIPLLKASRPDGVISLSR